MEQNMPYILRQCGDISEAHKTLPETHALPSAARFAECFFLSTRQRDPSPSARSKTLGKETFPECHALGKDRALGKEPPLPSVPSRHSANY